MTLAALCLLLALVQAVTLRWHLRRRTPAARSLPPMSILKPLCGMDDALEENLESFAALDYPQYEVLLGVRDASDGAFPLARAAAARWPGRFRVVLQRGAPGLNPKVNQLITLEQEARFEIVVISDSNVRVHASYLREIAAHLEDPRVGLVTHPVEGIESQTLGAAVDNLQMSAGITPGVAATKRLCGRDIVVGKSMALRRADVRALGGFARLKDVLAEDFIGGLLVSRELGKRVALASTPVWNVNREQPLSRTFSRYLRWSVMQRRAVGNATYAAQVFLHPLLFAPLAGRYAPLCIAAKMAIDALATRRLRLSLLSPLKDAVALAAWGCGLFTDEICWRGHLLRVLPGTTLLPVTYEEPALSEAG